MSSPGSTRPSRPIEPPPKSKTKHRKLITCLLSCCIFLAVFSVCLLAALVLIGKHVLYNTNSTNVETKTVSTLSDLMHRKILRLPRDVTPIHYDITLKPNFKTSDYVGNVDITINVTESRNDIILHSKHLKINDVNLTMNGSDEVIHVQNVVEDKVDEILRIILKKSIEPGEYNLVIDFSGNLTNRTTGLYLSSYVDKQKGLRKMATSKFEPTYARQAYPCFDEPNMKAKFTVHLLKPGDENYIALSNMPEEEQSTPLEDGSVLVHFKESVEMSTYLSCFIVSDFKSTEEVTFGDEQTLRVFATPAQLEKAIYARDTAKGVIEYFIKYFDIPFPLPKLDLAAIPDFVSGAMEHWGLVTFRETALLYSEEISSSANKQRVATVISHELAHSWFGNLVTMNWWNDIWLNEGFASYIEYKGVDEVESDWQMMTQFLIADLHPVLILDATLGSHPIVQTVLTPNEITAIFDTISYNKGAAVLRMLEDVVGEDNFQKGVTQYLNENKYGNAVTQDLWNALQSVANTDPTITEFMDTWTIQMGYPVIDVRTEGTNYILTQRRYLTDPEAVDNTLTPYDYKWTIPVTYITSESDKRELVWFKHTDSQIVIPKPTTASWVKFNYDQVGYYRVNYETDEWETLTDNVPNMTVADRSHLLEETFRLAESGDLVYYIPMNLSLYLREELEYIPWRVMSTILTQLKLYLSDSAVYTSFQEYVKDIVDNAYEKLGWDDADDAHLSRLARVEILDIACSVGHEGCLQKASELFENWLTGGSVSQNLRALVYNYGTTTASASKWQLVYEKFEAETDAQEKLRIMNGLAQTKETTLLTRLIEIAKTDGVVRGQDYFTLLSYISANPVGRPIVWDYVRENWEDLVNRFGLNERYLGTMIPSITKRFTTKTKLEEMQAFFTKYPEAGAGASARVQAIETVENNIKWLAKYKDEVEAWISDYAA